jgi:hypothetical protein
MMLKSFLLLICCIALTFSAAYGQRFLVLETRGKIKTKKFPIGAHIRVHLKEDKPYLWHQYDILALDEKNACIWVSDHYCIPLAQIDGFDITPYKGNAMANTFAKFALPYSIYMAYQAIRGPRISTFQASLGIFSAVGWLVSKIFLSGKLKIGANRRLRIIDLTMERPRA